MSISLQKGQKVNLSKENSGLSKVMVGLGWDEATAGSGKGFLASMFSIKQDIDCDASAILLKNGVFENTRKLEDLVYFGNLTHKSRAIRHMGDNLTGAGDGDDEQIEIDLQKLPAEYDRVVIFVNIYNAVSRKQDFGMIKNAFIRLVDTKTGREMCRYNLTEDYPGVTAVIFGEIYRHNNEWKFNAVGQGTKDPDIVSVVRRYL